MKEADTAAKDALCSKIEKVLSDILSEKYGCKVTLHFVPKVRSEEEWMSA